MKNALKLLINPEVKSAYFSEYIKVALEELRICLPEIEASHEKIGPLDFIKLECSEEELLTLGQLSFFGELSKLKKMASFLLNMSLSIFYPKNSYSAQSSKEKQMNY